AAERGHAQPHGERPSVARNGVGREPAQVADSAPAVDRRVAVEDLLPPPFAGHAERVAAPGHGSEVEDDEHLAAALAAAEGPQDPVLDVVAVDPLEPRGLAVELVEGPLLAVEPVEITDPLLDPGVGSPVRDVPVQASVVVPLALLAELPAHEQQLLAGLAELV